MVKVARFILSYTVLLPAMTMASGPEELRESVQKLAATWLKESTAHVACDDRHYIYGVGYIDGTYMERIFYVRSDRNSPLLSVRFRDSNDVVISSVQDFGPLSFVLEMKVPAAWSALPVGGEWKLAPEGWESALRFKYTSWYGTVERRDGAFQVSWQGYRRPMLPASVTGRVKEVCDLFPNP